MKRVIALSVFIFSILVFKVSAHVVVKPAEVGIGTFQTFSVGVPVEKDIPTTQIRLVIPEGVTNVTPNVKAGWEIEVKKEGTGEEVRTTEVIWKNGNIAAGLRDDFLFSARTPSSEARLAWKAYQTYEDGEVVAWEMEPNSDGGHDTKPYSVTNVINDLNNEKADNSDLSFVALGLGIISLLVSAGVLAFLLRRA